MKKYTSGAFVSTTYGIYKAAMDTITSFPASIIANGGNISPWAVYGNTVEGASVGEKTANLCTGEFRQGGISSQGVEVPSNTRVRIYCTVSENTTYTFKSNQPIRIIYAYNDDSTVELILDNSINPNMKQYTFTTSESVNKIGIALMNSDNTNIVPSDVENAMLNEGSTAADFEPYGYKVSIICATVTYICYISDVLRKSSGADPVYDIMSSTGIITRNVNTDGTPLVTPTTESFTAPTLATVAGSQSVNFDTTVKPSKAELTYTGWHTHSDKKRSGGAWT